MVINTGASTCTTPFESNFIGSIEYFEKVQTDETDSKVTIEVRGIIR